jgi:hypothetical protein
MAEYFTWVFSENSHVTFFARVAEADLEGFRPRFDEVIDSSLVL